MRASDIMTTSVVSVGPDTEVKEIAGLLLKHRISAVPVVNKNDQVIGLVSEGDLMRRAENDTEDRHAWWLAELVSTRNKPADYIKSHGRRASDVMTRAVISVEDDAPLNEIASLLERHHIKRVPVIREDRLVGIVSRANLLHGLAAQRSDAGGDVAPDDKELRERIMKEVSQAAGVDAPLITATVNDGTVQLWGSVDHATKKQAALVAAESIEGVKSVQNNIALIPPWVAAY